MSHLCFAICTSVGGRMSHAICMWHVHPLDMRMHFVMHIQIILQMYSWYPIFLCINIRNTHVHTHTHTFTYSFCIGVVQYDSAPTLLILVQWGSTVLLRAAYGGSVPLVRALLEDYGSSVDEVDEVSCSSNVKCYRVTMFSCMFTTAVNAPVHL